MFSIPAPTRRIAIGGAAVALLLAASLLFGCSSGARTEQTIDLGSGSETAETPESRPTPRVIAVATPAVWPTPFGTPSLRADSTPQATATVAPIRQLPELASSLDDKIVALAAALGARDTDRALRLQQELLAEADRVEQLLQVDQSAQADLVRQAIREIRSGAAGDPSKLDSARAKLRVASGQPPDSTTASGQSPQALASDIQTRLKSFNDARKEGRVESLLKLQQELMVQISQAEKAIANQHSDSADKLRSALQDIKSGLTGDDAKLKAGTAALLAVGGASASATPGSQEGASSQQIQSAAASLDGKIAALQSALSGGSRDQLLRAQRELLEEVARAEGAIQSGSSEEAKRLREALSAARDGASGDPAKLESARSKLADMLGAAADSRGEPERPGQPSQRPDAAAIANDLSRQVDSYKEAIERGDRGTMLRLQQQLLEQVNRDEEALKGISGQPAEQLRSALSDLRNALGGDLSKLNSANATLRLVGAGSDSGQQPLQPSAPQPQGGEETQKAARALSATLDDAGRALRSGNPEDLARVQKELQQAEDSLQSLPPADATALRSAIGAAREALSGDQTKLEQARNQVNKLIPR